MSQTTPTIGLKKPEGSDPFLTEDFAANYDKIDAAFAARPAGSGGSQVDAATLGGSPKSYFYGPHNPPPATGVGSHTHADYALAGHTHAASGGTGLTKAEADGYYAPISHGSHSGGGSTYTEPGDIIKSPGRNQPRVVFTNTEVTFNGVNGVNGAPVNYANAGYTTAPSIVVSAEVGSNWDMVVNVQGRTSTNATARIARITGATTSGTARIHWFIGGVAA